VECGEDRGGRLRGWCVIDVSEGSAVDWQVDGEKSWIAELKHLVMQVR